MSVKKRTYRVSVFIHGYDATYIIAEDEETARQEVLEKYNNILEKFKECYKFTSCTIEEIFVKEDSEKNERIRSSY